MLPKVGRVRMDGKAQGSRGQGENCQVKKYRNGEWYAIIAVEMKEPKMKESKNPVGADSGLADFIYLSNGLHVENPKLIKKHERRIRKAQKALSRKKLLLADRWQNYNNAKDDWQWNLAKNLVYILHRGISRLE